MVGIGKNYNEEMPNRIITMATLVAMLFFVCRMAYAGYIAMPYPKSIDDAANIALTNTFLDERSPYTLESIERFVPDINYSHPFINSILAAWITNVFFVAPVNAHFIISILSILLSGHFGYMIMKRYSDAVYVRFLAGFLLMLCHWNNGFISSSPNDLGMFIYILTMYIVVKDHTKYDAICISILVTICFYTAPLYSLVIVPAIIYAIIRSLKEAFILIGWTVGINSVIAWFITTTWPLYWTRAFVFQCLGLNAGEPKTALILTSGIVRLLLPPAIIAILSLFEKRKKSEIKGLEMCISAMAVIITSFIGEMSI